MDDVFKQVADIPKAKSPELPPPPPKITTGPDTDTTSQPLPDPTQTITDSSGTDEHHSSLSSIAKQSLPVGKSQTPDRTLPMSTPKLTPANVSSSLRIGLLVNSIPRRISNI